MHNTKIYLVVAFLVLSYIIYPLALQAEESYIFLHSWPVAVTGVRSPWGVAVDSSGDVYVVNVSSHCIQKFGSDGTYIKQWGDLGTENGEFNHPNGIAVDSLNNVYVVDTYNQRIQKFSSNGVYITQWGGFGSGNGKFIFPQDVAADSSGNVYVSDTDNERIQKFDSNGTYLTQWGTEGSGDGEFESPHGVATDSSGNVYVVDRENDCVQKFDSNGTYLNRWGTEGSGNGEFRSPEGIAVDGSGNFYVVDSWNNRIQKFGSDGIYLAQWGTKGSGNGEFNVPANMALDSSGNLYVSDGWNHRIQKLNSSGVYLTQWGVESSSDGQFNAPHGIAVDDSGSVYVYVVDTDNNRIQKFSSGGTSIIQWGEWGTGDGEFEYPHGIAVDNSGDVYVTDNWNDRIQKFDSNGTYLTQWGSFGSGDGEFFWPRGIAIDNSGNIYVVDYFHDRVQKFDSGGTYLTQWGSEGDGNGEFDGPNGVAVDNSGNVYVADSSNRRIQKFDSNGTYLTQWGEWGDGEGEFKSPQYVAVDNSGNVYVTDGGNHRIQKFDSNGTYITQWGSLGSNDGQFNSPSGIAVDNSGNVYVADTDNHRIQVFQKYTGSGETPKLEFQALSPVDLIVTDPAGRSISMTENQIPSAVYVEEDMDSDGEPDDRIAIYEPIPGYYSIRVVSEPGANPGDTYTLRVIHDDQVIIKAENAPVQELPLDYTSFCSLYYLKPGWHLISLPLEPQDDRPGAVLTSIDGKYDSVWTYDSSGGWDIYVPDAPSDLTEMKLGEGYWIKMDEAGTLRIGGTEPAETAISLTGNAWNLVGYNSLETQETGACMRSVEDSINSVWAYDSSEGWDIYVPDAASDLEYMRPGQGYWIKADEDCDWDVGGDAAPAPPLSLASVRSSISTGKPQMPYVIWGNIDTPGQNNDAHTVLLQVDSTTLASRAWRKPEGHYMLYVPTDVDFSAQPEIYIQIGDSIMNVATVPPGRPGQIIRLDLFARALPEASILHQNYPNPFNPDTWIPYQLSEDADVTIRIFAASGRLVRTLSLGSKPAGFYVGRDKAAYWDGRNEVGESVSSGVYFYSIQAGKLATVRKMVIVQ